MWEEGIHIYGTLRVPNNFPQKNAQNYMCGGFDLSNIYIQTHTCGGFFENIFKIMIIQLLQ